jgi:hypothetical protein
MQFADRQVEISTFMTTLKLQAHRHRLDVVLHHPELATMTDHDRLRVAFMVLDRLLGEDAVERWLGEVRASPEPLPQALPATALLDAVMELEERESDGAHWVELTAKRSDGALVFIKARRPMRWIDNLTFDHHLAVRVPYRPAGGDGQPDNAERERLSAIARELSDGLGPAGLLVAKVRCAGRCDIHAYFDDEDVAASSAARWWVASGPHRSRAVTTYDPSWHNVRSFA